MKLFTTVLAVFVLVAASEAGSKCVWGPSYWCQSSNSARECGKESYCLLSVWKVKTDNVQLSVKGAIECKVCEMVMEEVEKLIETNTTEAEVVVAIEKVCAVLGPLDEECKDLIGKYFDQIWKLIIDKADPKTLCTDVSLCTKSKSLQLVKAPQDGCSLCKTAVGLLKTFVDSNNSEDEVKDALEDVCKLLPGNVSSECSELIDSYFGLMWTLVKSEVDDGKICELIKLCNSTTCTGHHETPKAVEADLCDICKLVSSYLKTFVDAGGSEAEVKNAVEGLCKILPGNYSTNCTKLIDDNFDMIWDLIKMEVDGGDICKQIGVCNSTTAHFKVEAVSQPKDSECQLCELVVKFITPFVNSNSSEQRIKSALSLLCSFLPGDAKQECNEFVSKNLDDLWNLVKKDVDSDVICKQIGLCTSKVVVKAVALPKAGGCDVCKTVLAFLDLYVEKNSTETEVKDALEKFCGLIKSSECSSLVTEYFDLVWQLVKGEVSNDEFCKQTGLCPTTTNVLAVSTLPVEDSPLCQICELATTYIKHFVDDSSNEDELMQQLEGLCSILPGNYSTQCKSFVDKYFDQLWQIVKGEVDADKLCKDTGLCSTPPPVAKTIMIAPTVKADIVCDVCQLVVPFLKHFVDSNTTKVEAKAAVDELCGKVPKPYGDQCSSLVDEYFDLIWNLLESYVDDKQICSELKLCKSSSVVTQSQDPKGLQCPICEFVMKELDSLLDGNTSTSAVEAALEKVCSILPSTIQSECKDLLDQFTPEIIQYLVQELDPKEICTKLGLCSSAPQKVKTTPKAGVLCIVCEFVMKEVDNLLNGNTSEAAVEAALDKVCDILPSSFKTDCDAFVKAYAPDIVKFITQKLSPTEVCTALKLCTSAQPAVPKAGILCELCETVIGKLENLLPVNATEADIEKALDSICGDLGILKDECKKFVDMYTPQIVQYILQQIGPDEICGLLKLCTSSKQTTLVATPTLGAPKSGVLCVVCEYVMKEVTSILDGNTSKAAIEDALDKVCSVLPASVKTDCTAFVDKWAPEILDLLLKDAAPKAVCTLLHLCLFSEQREVQLVKKFNGASECDVCKTTLTILKTLIASKAAEETVEEVLDKACGLMPDEIKDECVGLVKTYGSQIIQLVDQEIEPDVLCKDLKLCKKTSVLMQPWVKLLRSREL